MVYRRRTRRRFIRRRRFGGRRRTFKRRFYRRRGRRVMKSNSQRNNMIFVKKTVRGADEVTADTTGVAYSFNAVGGLTQTTFDAYAALYEMYKLCMVKVKVTWMTDYPINEDVSAGAVCPILGLAEDLNDTVVPTGLQDIESRRRYKMSVMRPGQTMTFAIKPRLQKMAYLSAIGTAYMPGRGWLNVADGTVPHYGMKKVWQGSAAGVAATAVGVAQFEWTYYVAFKGRKAF